MMSLPLVHMKTLQGVQWGEKEGISFYVLKLLHFPNIGQLEVDAIQILFPQLSFYNHLVTIS